MKRLASMDCLFPLAAMLNDFSSTWPSQSSRSMWPGGDGRGRKSTKTDRGKADALAIRL